MSCLLWNIFNIRYLKNFIAVLHFSLHPYFHLSWQCPISKMEATGSEKVDENVARWTKICRIMVLIQNEII